jgi:predicted acylesterase/phospholipase RssA
VEIAMSMSKGMVQKAVNEFRSKSNGQVVLVLQGGGALGAYQVGVYEALHEAGIEPDWIIGTSIGAINASNKPQDRLVKLNEFWNRMERASPWPFVPAWTGISDTWSYWSTLLRGIPGFFDFTPSGIRMRREVGFEATMRALRQAPWQGEFDPIEGVILHESMPDLAIAAE